MSILSDEKDGFRSYFHDTFADLVAASHPDCLTSGQRLLYQNTPQGASICAVEEQETTPAAPPAQRHVFDGQHYYCSRPEQHAISSLLDKHVGQQVTLYLVCKRWAGEHVRFFYQARATLSDILPSSYKLTLQPVGTYPHELHHPSPTPLPPHPPLPPPPSNAPYAPRPYNAPRVQPPIPPPPPYTYSRPYAPPPTYHTGTAITYPHDMPPRGGSCHCSVEWVLFCVGFIFPPVWIVGALLGACGKDSNARRAALACVVALLVYTALLLPLYLSGRNRMTGHNGMS